MPFLVRPITDQLVRFLYGFHKLENSMSRTVYKREKKSDMLWTVHLEGGPQRVNHAAVAVHDKIYSFGGYSSKEGHNITGPIEIYVLNTETLRWTILHYDQKGKEVPFKRYGHSVVAHRNKIYLFAGRNNDVSSSTLHCFDIETSTWSLPPTYGDWPLAGDGHSACVIDNFMYIFGGYCDALERFAQSVYRINLFSFEWEKLNTSGVRPVCRDFHTASAIGHRMYIFGGRSSITNSMLNHSLVFYCNKIMYLDTISKMWHTPLTGGSTPCGRRSHSAVVYRNEIYIIGGFNCKMQDHFKDVYRFNPALNEWSFIQCKGEGPSERRRHCACMVGNQLFLFGGSSPLIKGQNISENEDMPSKLKEHSDLHVLDFSPTLKRLCQVKVIKYGLNVNRLPKKLININKLMVWIISKCAAISQSKQLLFEEALATLENVD